MAIKMNQQDRLKKSPVIKFTLALVLIMASPFLVYANSDQLLSNQPSQWQPLNSDKLIKLPVNIIERRIQQDYKASPLATRLVALDNKMDEHIRNVKALQKAVAQSQQQENTQITNAEQINQQFQILQNKSAYLDLLQESHALRLSAITQKQKLYQNVLKKLQRNNNKNINSNVYRLKQAQSNGRQRMEKVMAEVELTLNNFSTNQRSIYSSEYAKNVNKIARLKLAIAKHKGNASPALNGVEVSSQEYIRHLLTGIAKDQSLLEQEKLMLSYMAKLVALDAQSLEYQMANGANTKDHIANELSNTNNVTELFF